jgi:hypothetical protein
MNYLRALYTTITRESMKKFKSGTRSPVRGEGYHKLPVKQTSVQTKAEGRRTKALEGGGMMRERLSVPRGNHPLFGEFFLFRCNHLAFLCAF